MQTKAAVESEEIEKVHGQRADALNLKSKALLSLLR
jgi:hypothetical protein